ncbi:MAG: DUF1549 domain-containing protein, partial [Planctomycetes bacterium]|nr:DUF1549 domain-containing protein [Planctomycetota bacterium]
MLRTCFRLRFLTISMIATGWVARTVCFAQEVGRDNANASQDITFQDEEIEFFEKEVRPILVQRCFECHEGVNSKPKGGLRLTSREAILEGGDTGPAAVPTKPTESLLVSAINYGDLYQMPPKSKLPPKEIATLTRWVEMGMRWPRSKSTSVTTTTFDIQSRRAAHWCWQPIQDHQSPTPINQSWCRNSIDQFILAGLESRSLKPAAVADRNVLLRRLYFDLIGLPPTPQEVESFLKDQGPNAYENVVDRLLDSSHFGERWARHWLDLVRYAETRGHEFEPVIPNAWQYRDYVIRALNADVSYDRFVTEQIAGDLIEPRWRNVAVANGLTSAPISKDVSTHRDTHQDSLTNFSRINEAVLGTGFWFLGEEVHSPVDIRRDETDRMDNRIDVLTKTFLGLTVGCARCHDHKFDAISQRDYYALVGYALGGSYRQVRVQTDEQEHAIARQLAELRRETRDRVLEEFTRSSKNVVDSLDRYLIVAKETFSRGVEFEPSLPARLIADFETESWNDWKVEGTAFGDSPVKKGDNTYNLPLDGF